VPIKDATREGRKRKAGKGHVSFASGIGAGQPTIGGDSLDGQALSVKSDSVSPNAPCATFWPDCRRLREEGRGANVMRFRDTHRSGNMALALTQEFGGRGDKIGIK